MFIFTNNMQKSLAKEIADMVIKNYNPSWIIQLGWFGFICIAQPLSCSTLAILLEIKIRLIVLEINA